jgi:Holliday junction resolvasome RuvABC endonuclease subunit
MNTPKVILNTLHSELLRVTTQIENTLKSEQIENAAIEQTIFYLNETIRKLDHAVEKIQACKTN